MSSRRRSATIIFHRDGDPVSRSVRLPLWVLRVGLVFGIVLAALILISAVLFAPIVRTAARVPGLNRQIGRLTAENMQVAELAERLRYAEERYDQIRDMLGGQLVPELERREATLTALRPLFARAPDQPWCYESGPSTPRHWPLGEPGVITRGTVGAGSSAEVHTGLDIAVAQGTPVRATGGGVVSAAAEDPEYGLFVRIDHPGGYQSMYGHASRVLVTLGDSVLAGQVIALSGSTGRSTAPHLHFEILHDGQAVDPSTMVSRECTYGDILVRGG
jgi:murein DD-endopeptidase MepM/ murein hydrolase activator NlpD